MQNRNTLPALTWGTQSNNFTIVRLILALMVIFSHSYGLLRLREPFILGHTAGNLAVHGFFVISGYLVSGSYMQSSGASHFAAKRFLRLVPALVVGYFASRALMNLCGGYPHSFGAFVGNANGQLWTLSWEALMYVCVLGSGVLNLLKKEVIAPVFAVCLLLCALEITSPAPTAQAIAPMAMLFLAGCFLRIHRDDFDFQTYGVAAIGILALFFISPLRNITKQIIDDTLWAWGPNLSFQELRSVPYLLAFPFLVIFICKAFPFSVPIKTDISYGVYIYGWPVQQTVIHILVSSGITPKPLLLFAISAPISMLLGFVSWKLIEQWPKQLAYALPRSEPRISRILEE